MKKHGIAVIGLGFGDEGKGRVVDWLCRTRDVSHVVRFSGGQQAAHHVVSGETDHVFASFGSGTLAGVPTYVMKHCTIDPEAIFNEYKVLHEKGIRPLLRIDGKCPVTTPYDRFYNEETRILQANGTCNMGVGCTWQREEDRYSLLAEDLRFTKIVRAKLRLIRNYYIGGGCPLPKRKGEPLYEDGEDAFIRYCLFLNKHLTAFSIEDTSHFLELAKGSKTGCTTVFEGSQGLLLDPAIGFFPHVTRSTIGLTNLVKEGYAPKVTLVTRAYQTRHGNGPMTNEDIRHNIQPNPYEQNGDDGPQGKFRTSLLDVDLLKYAIMKESYLVANRDDLTLVITCLDLVENEWRYTENGRIKSCLNRDEFIGKIADALHIHRVFVSDSPEGGLAHWR